MANITKIILSSILFCLLGVVITYSIQEKVYHGYVKIHMTKSGTFLLDDNKIYTVSELLTERGDKVNLSGAR
jgi:hypothetical protein